MQLGNVFGELFERNLGDSDRERGRDFDIRGLGRRLLEHGSGCAVQCDDEFGAERQRGLYCARCGPAGNARTHYGGRGVRAELAVSPPRTETTAGSAPTAYISRKISPWTATAISTWPTCRTAGCCSIPPAAPPLRGSTGRAAASPPAPEQGTVSANSLNNPYGLAVDSSGGLYVADCGNNRVLFYPAGSTTATRVYGQNGSFTTINYQTNNGVSANSLMARSQSPWTAAAISTWPTL